MMQTGTKASGPGARRPDTSLQPETLGVGEGDEEVHLDHMTRSVWIVKIPKSLGAEWDAIEEGNVELGWLRMHHDPEPVAGAASSASSASQNKPRVTLHLKRLPAAGAANETKRPKGGMTSVKNGLSSASAPLEYNMEFNSERDTPQMRVFSTAGDGQGVELHGTVEYTCSLMPLRTGNTYDSLLAKRKRDQQSRFRKTQIMDGAEELKVLSHRRQVIKLEDPNASGSTNRSNKRARTGVKTEYGVGGGSSSSSSAVASGSQSYLQLGSRPNVDAVRDGIFKLFNLEDPPGSGMKQSHWTLKQLKAGLGMEETTMIKDVLKRIATYNHQGPHAMAYELRSEYR